MFQMTQGGGEGEPVVTSPKNDKFDNYLIALEKSGIDKRIEEAQILFELWDKRCKETEAELRQSGDISDRIYVKRAIEHKGSKRIAREMHYSKSQVNRILRKMRQNAPQSMVEC